MTVTASQVTKVVFDAVDSFNRDENHSLPRSAEVALLGATGTLDSLALVRFIITVEQRVETDLQASVSLTDERAMSQRNSPYRTLGTLIEYITATVNEGAS